MSRGEMVVPKAAMEGAGKAVVAEMKAAAAEVETTQMEAMAAKVAPAKMSTEMAAASRLRIRCDGDSQNRSNQGCKYDGTYSNSTM